MKKSLLVIVPFLIFFAASLTSCDPTVENEQELITTVKLTLTSMSSDSVVTLLFQDLDGDGGNAPITTVSGTIAANQSYNAKIDILDETATPADDITTEVEAEGINHQLFYLPNNGLNLTFAYSDVDANAKPIGISTAVSAGSASNGTLRIVLRHEPDKSATNVSMGDITNAGGETDFDVEFDVVVQ